MIDTHYRDAHRGSPTHGFGKYLHFHADFDGRDWPSANEIAVRQTFPAADVGRGTVGRICDANRRKVGPLRGARDFEEPLERLTNVKPPKDPRHRPPYPRSARIGMERTRFPVASNTALAMAGAITMMGVSPAPAGSRSLRSSRITSILGTSWNRGTW